MNGDTTQKIKAIIQKRYDTFVRIYINHVFSCKPCDRLLSSKNLRKVVDDEGKKSRVCPICGHVVEDVTFTPRAESWRAIVRPDLEIDPQDRPV